MPKETPSLNAESKKTFDLEERTAVFGEEVIRFAKIIPHIRDSLVISN